MVQTVLVADSINFEETNSIVEVPDIITDRPDSIHVPVSFSYKRTTLSQELKQLIYNTWISNSAVSTDRNTMIRIRKRLYLQKFGNIINEDVVLEETRNNRNILYMSCK